MNIMTFFIQLFNQLIEWSSLIGEFIINGVWIGFDGLKIDFLGYKDTWFAFGFQFQPMYFLGAGAIFILVIALVKDFIPFL